MFYPFFGWNTPIFKSKVTIVNVMKKHLRVSVKTVVFTNSASLILVHFFIT